MGANAGDAVDFEALPRGETHWYAVFDANRKLDELVFSGADRLVSSAHAPRVRRDGDRFVLGLRREEFTPGGGTRLRGMLY